MPCLGIQSKLPYQAQTEQTQAITMKIKAQL